MSRVVDPALLQLFNVFYTHSVIFYPSLKGISYSLKGFPKALLKPRLHKAASSARLLRCRHIGNVSNATILAVWLNYMKGLSELHGLYTNVSIMAPLQKVIMGVVEKNSESSPGRLNDCYAYFSVEYR